MLRRDVEAVPDWKNLKDKAMGTLNTVAKEVDRQIALTKLRAAVTEAQSQHEKTLASLGEAIHARLKAQEPIDATEGPVAALVRAVDEAQARLAEAQQALKAAALEADADRCPACGAPAEPSAKFCSTCGQALAGAQ